MATAVGGMHPTGMHSCFSRTLDTRTWIYLDTQANKAKLF